MTDTSGFSIPMNKSKQTFILSLLVLCLALSGCMTLSPATFQGTANGYNIALQRTNDEQLLLNVVRLKYRDTPFFLEASAFTSQFDYNTNASIGGVFPLSGDGPDVLNGGAGISFSERPTISYTPLQGEEFVSRLLRQISFNTIALLYNSGWSIDAVSRMVIQRVNGIDNAPGASGPTPGITPVYRDFNRLADLMFTLQRTGLMQLGEISRDGEADNPVLYLPSRGESAEADEVRRILGLNPDLNEYRVIAGSGWPRVENTDRIVINTRSLLGVLYYLAQAVESPEEHKERGWVTRTLNTDGSEFDWNLALGGLFKVHADSSQPDDVAIATNYRGRWFFIRNNDLLSKSTFTILSQLFALVTGDTPGQAPLLTIPVSN